MALIMPKLTRDHTVAGGQDENVGQESARRAGCLFCSFCGLPRKGSFLSSVEHNVLDQLQDPQST